ncbi:MAG TPA: hypothetical protein VK750_07130, partial [Cytophagaceae bacterium]|nr:hypothetical protein [Cytophagaceae bacterium]
MKKIFTIAIQIKLSALYFNKKYISSLLGIIGFFLLSTNGYSQTTTSPIAFSPICAGSIIPVTYQAPSGDFFVIELSDASGSFAAPTTLWSGLIFSFSAVNPTQSVTIPLGTSTGSGYRIRVNGVLNPASGDNGSNLTINATAVLSPPTSFTTSSAAVCQGQSGVAYKVPAVAGATSYSWSYSGTGATFTNGTTLNPTVAFSASATSGNISVSTINASGCSSNTSLTMAVTVNTLPAQPSVITPSVVSPCNSSAGITYTVTNVAGVTYAWSYSGTGAVITSGSTSNSITVTYTAASNGTWTVTPSNACGNGTAQTLAVTLIAGAPAQPSVITPSVVSPCNSSAGITYTVTNVAGVTYAWSYSGTGAVITGGSTSNSITVTYTAASNGTWTVTPSNACGNGTARTLAVVLIAGAPAQPSVITPSVVSPCNTSAGITYTVTNVAGVTYAWSYSGTGAVITGG